MSVTGMSIARRADRGFDEARVDLARDVVDRAASVQVGGLAHRDLQSLGRYLVEVEPRIRDAAGRLLVKRDARFAPCRRRPPTALHLDKRSDGRTAVTDHAGRAADGGAVDRVIRGIMGSRRANLLVDQTFGPWSRFSWLLAAAQPPDPGPATAKVCGRD